MNRPRNAAQTLPLSLLGSGADPLGTASRLPAVPLPELLAAAGLQSRFDRKYVLPVQRLPELLARLGDGARVLEIDGRRSFRYDSVYFDTPGYEAYLLAARGRPRRYKVRTRRYLDSGGAFLEVKTRDGRGRTVKHRTGIHPAGPERLDRRARAFVRAALRDTAASPASADRLRAVLRTRYRRTTLLLADGGCRATIDLAPEWAAPDGSGLVRPDRMAIVETKSAGGANELDRLLWRAGLRPRRISKYASGIALLHPRLPANRWHRLLREDFPERRGAP